MKLERRVIIGFVICMFALAGLLGWHYTQPRPAPACANAAAHCGDRPFGAAP
jgi:hypothetical protein